MSIANGKPQNNWRPVTATCPCAICGHTKWCSVSSDGTVAKCMHHPDGAFRTKKDKNGQEFYLHRLDGTAPVPPAPPAPSTDPAIERATADTLHAAYSALLAGLRLSMEHREALRRRGLTDEEIDRRGYRTLPIRGRFALASRVRDSLGDAVLSVPGFVVKTGEGGTPYITLAGAAGLLVPVRDSTGRIVALTTRRDDTSDGRGKYLYLSSTRAGGPGPGAPPHIPLGVTAGCQVYRLTEGALKADIAFALSGAPIVGAAGLSWQPVLDVLLALGASGVRLAFDADSLDNPHVARALAKCFAAAGDAGLAVELERWDKADGKGIDELLAAGKTPKVLTGEDARRAAAEILAAATADAGSGPTDELARFQDVLHTGGAAALFADRPLLTALAQLADADPSAFAGYRAALRGLVSLRDLDAALKPLRSEQARKRPPVLLAEAGYCVDGGRLCRTLGTSNGGTALVPLCNFTARRTETVVRDDGAEKTAQFIVAGALADGRQLPPVAVPAAAFDGLGWVTTAWHGEAVVYAGMGTRDHLRAAIELLSPNPVRRTIYSHTGWIRIGNDWHYLHGGGAIGPAGASEGVIVELPEALARFVLPSPPDGPELVLAIRASIGVLSLGPGRLLFPVLAAVYRSVLGECDFSLHLVGATGRFKTEVASLCQQHFGAGLDARNLPGSWISTANALEGIAFVAKDTLVVFDDFAPSGSITDVQKCHREAARLFRAQGNRAGRSRMRADITLRPDKPPRGLILSTGEDIPRGQSIRARVLTHEFCMGDIIVTKLTEAQRDAAAGLYASCMSDYLRWLAPRYDDIRAGMRQEQTELRERALAAANGQHARTPRIVADLAFGMKHFLDFAVDTGAITVAEADELCQRCWEALGEAAAAQERTVQADDPCELFLRLLSGAIASGRCHVAGPNGDAPTEAERWGWRCIRIGTGEDIRGEWRPQGHCVGWVKDGDMYLQTEAAYAEVQEMARHQGGSIPVEPQTLWKRLKEHQLLASWDARRQRNTVRRTLGGEKDREVLHLRSNILSTGTRPSEPSATPPQHHETRENQTVSADGSADGRTGSPQNRPPKSSAETDENASCGRFGRSATGVETPPANNAHTNGQRRKGTL